VAIDSLNLEDDPVLIEKNGDRSDLSEFTDDAYAVPLSLDLSEDPILKFAGFQACVSSESTPINPAKTSFYEPKDFWTPVKPDSGNVEIKKEQFYIFRSRERFRIPGHMAVDCRAYSEGLGDIRIHYAGFAHPLFGKLFKDGTDNPKGAPLIFEVRGFSMNTILRDGSILAKVYFRRMSRAAIKTDGAYSNQELRLSKVFKDWH
jgi:deoxycytidine triphosphate deaminase